MTQIRTQAIRIPAKSLELLRNLIKEATFEFQLSKREKEVLELLMYHGFQNKQIARLLLITEKTVKNHITSILSKTKTNSTRELQSCMLCFLVDSRSEAADQVLHQTIQTVRRDSGLSNRETEMLEVLVKQGISSQEMADHFIISQKTVLNHISEVLRKTNSQSSRELLSLIFRAVLEEQSSKSPSEYAG